MLITTETLCWERSKFAFEADGSLRDIHVLNTTIDDWRTVLAFIATRPFEARLECRGQTVELPADPSGLFWRADESAHFLLSFWIAGVDLCCHFFAEEEIEFDFWPNDMSEDRLIALLVFMRDIGKLTRKEVILTPESWKERPIFRYDPVAGTIDFVAS